MQFNDTKDITILRSLFLDGKDTEQGYNYYVYSGGWEG